MSNHVRRYSLLLALAVPFAALTACFDDDGDAAEGPKRATNDVSFDLSSSTIAAIGGMTFTFADGSSIDVQSGPDFPAGTIRLTFTNTGAANPSFSLTSAGGSASGTVAFGSCTFSVTSSTYPSGQGPQVGDTIVVQPCQVNVGTTGVQATGQATAVQIALQLGLTPSAAQQAQVSIDPDTGEVTVNGVATGVTVTLTVTGASSSLITF